MMMTTRMSCSLVCLMFSASRISSSTLLSSCALTSRMRSCSSNSLTRLSSCSKRTMNARDCNARTSLSPIIRSSCSSSTRAWVLWACSTKSARCPREPRSRTSKKCIRCLWGLPSTPNLPEVALPRSENPSYPRACRSRETWTSYNSVFSTMLEMSCTLQSIGSRRIVVSCSQTSRFSCRRAATRCCSLSSQFRRRKRTTRKRPRYLPLSGHLCEHLRPHSSKPTPGTSAASSPMRTRSPAAAMAISWLGSCATRVCRLSLRSSVRAIRSACQRPTSSRATVAAPSRSLTRWPSRSRQT
mmetsp:Transcript_52198/g.117234  ORF Transcript_52198/g.117234 Transcript_52198/m.117234 type:complete len:299 (+) Transcript_52198:1294-2190(+)